MPLFTLKDLDLDGKLYNVEIELTAFGYVEHGMVVIDEGPFVRSSEVEVSEDGYNFRPATREESDYIIAYCMDRYEREMEALLEQEARRAA